MTDPLKTFPSCLCTATVCLISVKGQGRELQNIQTAIIESGIQLGALDPQRPINLKWEFSLRSSGQGPKGVFPV